MRQTPATTDAVQQNEIAAIVQDSINAFVPLSERHRIAKTILQRYTLTPRAGA